MYDSINIYIFCIVCTVFAQKTYNGCFVVEYFEPSKISSLINKQTLTLSFFHLLISSLSHHLKKFSTILTKNKLDFYFFRDL